jgi:hypothetical protein
LEKAYTEIARRADENDPAAQFALAMSNIADSVRLRDSSLLERAEQWLKKSAGASYEEASGFLRSSWDDVKKTRLKMIAAAKEKDRRGR